MVCDRIGYLYSPEAYAPCDLTAVRWDHNFMYDVCTKCGSGNFSVHSVYKALGGVLAFVAFIAKYG